MGWKIDDGRPIWTQLKEQMTRGSCQEPIQAERNCQVSGILQEKQG